MAWNDERVRGLRERPVLVALEGRAQRDGNPIHREQPAGPTGHDLSGDSSDALDDST